MVLRSSRLDWIVKIFKKNLPGFQLSQWIKGPDNTFVHTMIPSSEFGGPVTNWHPGSGSASLFFFIKDAKKFQNKLNIYYLRIRSTGRSILKPAASKIFFKTAELRPIPCKDKNIVFFLNTIDVDVYLRPIHLYPIPD
jgi:hypothetical protein